MELSLPIRSRKLSSTTTLSNIIRSLTVIILDRSNDFHYLPTLFPTFEDLNWDEDSWVTVLYNLKQVFDHVDDLLPPEMSGEIRTSLLNMEYEADFLGEKIKWNGTFLHWRLPKAKSEAELGEIRAKCLERWMGVLKYWDAECRKFFDPKSNLEVDMAAQMAALGLERDKR